MLRPSQLPILLQLGNIDWISLLDSLSPINGQCHNVEPGLVSLVLDLLSLLMQLLLSHKYCCWIMLYMLVKTLFNTQLVQILDLMCFRSGERNLAVPLLGGRWFLLLADGPG